MAYSALALLPPNTKHSQAELVKNLQEKFNGMNVEIKIENETFISIRVNNWKLRIYYNDRPSVIIESQEIADFYGKDRKDKDIIAMCASRYEIASDNDPNMDCFNYYIWALNALEKFEGIILFDNGRFI